MAADNSVCLNCRKNDREQAIKNTHVYTPQNTFPHEQSIKHCLRCNQDGHVASLCPSYVQMYSHEVAEERASHVSYDRDRNNRDFEKQLRQQNRDPMEHVPRHKKK